MQEIEKSLHKLKLPGMADCWTSLCETRRADKLSLRDGLQLMLQTEQDTRKTNRIARLLREAAFPYPASLEELDYDTSRGVDATTVAQLGTCEFIHNGQTIVINGPTGTGKTYLAVALGNRACRLGFNVGFFTMQSKHPKSAVFLFHNQTLIFALKKVCSV